MELARRPRVEVVAFALVGLLIITIVAVLYFGKAFFLPVVMAFVVGTMLSPAASFLERFRIPRSVGAVLIVLAVGALAFLVAGDGRPEHHPVADHLGDVAARVAGRGGGPVGPLAAVGRG